MRFVLVNSDGTIAGIGGCKDDAISAQVVPTGGQLVQLADTDSFPNQSLDIYDLVAKTFSPGVAGTRSQKITSLQQTCDRLIVGGFTSEALGSTKYYGSNDTDQANMARTAVTGGLLMCGDSAGGTWTLTDHDPEQALRVLTDFGTMCDAARSNLATKSAAATAATNVGDINAIVW
jgi:hypothetical protein